MRLEPQLMLFALAATRTNGFNKRAVFKPYWAAVAFIVAAVDFIVAPVFANVAFILKPRDTFSASNAVFLAIIPIVSKNTRALENNLTTILVFVTPVFKAVCAFRGPFSKEALSFQLLLKSH